METYNFPLFSWTTRYPESSAKVQFGRGYEFASQPRGPDQVIYVLNYATMVFYLNTDGTLNKTRNPPINMALLEDFYIKHRLFEKFIFPHPAKGNLTCRFNKPLEFTIAKGGLGTVEPFSVELRTQP